MKDNTLVFLALGAVGIYFLLNRNGQRMGSESMKNSGPLWSPLAKSGGVTTGPASSTVLQLPQTNNNAEVAQYINAGANLVRAVGDVWGNYKAATPAAYVLGPNDQIYGPAQGNAGTYYKAV